MFFHPIFLTSDSLVYSFNGLKNFLTSNVLIVPLSDKIAAVPVGKYKVSVVLLDPYPNNDKLKGAYSSKKTPLSCNLQDNTVFDIDIPISKK